MGDNSGLLLSGYRVLDLADEKGCFAGRVLADLGADVIKVEPPGGCDSRNIGPFYKNIPDNEKSLYWFFFNANKRGITLNIEVLTGQRLFRELVGKVDIVIESFQTGYLKGLQLDYQSLKKIKPDIIMASITPFGQNGPYSKYRASDLTTGAMGGMMYVTGDPDRPPVRVSFQQSYSHGGAAGALGVIMALFHRKNSGEGQHIDVSIQECVIRTLMNARQFWDVNQVNLKRSGQFRTGLSTAANQRLVWRCKDDGYVNFPIFGGYTGAKTNRALTRWMAEEGMDSEYMTSMDWDQFDMANTTQEEFNILEGAISRFFMTHTKTELYESSFQRGIMLYPLNNIAEITENEQLKQREFWLRVRHDDLGGDVTITYPGAFTRLSNSNITIRRRAPQIGEHNEEIYSGELKLSREDIIILREGNVI